MERKYRKKSSEYRHSEETLKIVTENNKNNAVKIKMINIDTGEELFFESWKEAGNYFGITPEGLQKAEKEKVFIKNMEN